MIDKLEFLLALAQERHFGRAAEACGVTQPTLSAGLKQLEETLGAPLVERSSRFLGFTPEGERALEWARRMVGDARAMRKELEALKRGLAGDFRIAAIPSAMPVVALLTAPFYRKHPDVRFVILSRTSSDVLRLLGNLEVEIGVTYLDNEPLGRVARVPVCEERYHLLTAAEGPLAGRPSVTWAEIASIPICLLTPDMQNRRIIDAELRKAGVSPHSTLESNSMVVLFAHVATGQWSTITSAKLGDMFAGSGRTRSIPIVEPDVRHVIGVVAPEREPALPITAAFMRHAKRSSHFAAAASPAPAAE